MILKKFPVLLCSFGLVFGGGVGVSTTAAADTGLSAASTKNLSELNLMLTENLEMLSEENFQINFDTRINTIERKRDPNILTPQTLIRTGKTQKIFVRYADEIISFADNSLTPTHSVDDLGVMTVSLDHLLTIAKFSKKEEKRIREEAKQKSGDNTVLLVYDTENPGYPYISQLLLGSIFVLDAALPQNVVLENTRNAQVSVAKQKNGKKRFTVVEEPLRTKLNNIDVKKTTKIFEFDKKGFLTSYRYFVNNNTYLSSSRITFKTTVKPLEGDTYLPDELGIYPEEEE
jgi:hypothetical protein